ncbi:DUF1206 domain-containing protein [Microbacterium sp. SSM24]|uniref:DUF1206 domain-containing protein n=1 Tax=Microbacterium sp. SSM24 TaxID=2991714 RepID=UPI0022275DB2|nr:DUF1206 domain-containing protein [Microbacterium sp. SSM24]MCW3493960.1 DUF1206 domain-containing protein [Microbacterium sp. SSM24]
MTTSTPKAAAKAAAREAEASPAFVVLARSGYVANGILHVLIGVLVVILAFGGRVEGDQAGVLKAVASAPLGVVLLWLIAIAFWALGLWHLAEGTLMRDRTGDLPGAARKWGRRVAEWGQALVFVALGIFAAAIALGARPTTDETAEDASRGLLEIPGGSIVLALIGIGIGAGGVSFVVMGVLRSFRKRMDIPEGGVGRSITIAGVVGFIAKGIALIIVGVLLLIAAVRTDAATAAGLDGAFDALLQLTLGPVLVGIVGGGFIAYGAFTIARARYARM